MLVEGIMARLDETCAEIRALRARVEQLEAAAASAPAQTPTSTKPAAQPAAAASASTTAKTTAK